MNSLGTSVTEGQKPDGQAVARIPIGAGLVAIAITYFVAATNIGGLGIIVTAIVAVLFAAACVMSGQFRSSRPETRHLSESPAVPENIFDEIEDRLVALDEANEVFGTALNSADMFRLVSSRIGEIFPLSAAALVVPDEAQEKLRFVNFDGSRSDLFRGLEIPISDGLAGRALASGSIEINNRLGPDIAALGAERVSGFASSAAIPLLQGGSVFAVYQLFTDGIIGSDEDTMKLLVAISDHVTPIFRSSLAFERSLSSALTDPLTGLPNERAFFMVLENQLAESLRHREDRPLTVLAIDIRDFGAVNSMLGHAVGDRMLEFAGQRIGENLRKMDFLARTVSDEFSVVLPTASEKVAFEIIERIKAGFLKEEFEIANGEGVSVALNIGWATFWQDGETTDQLLRAAQQRKRQAKSEAPSGVLWFPKEYVN